jgi:hypothetical protein
VLLREATSKPRFSKVRTTGLTHKSAREAEARRNKWYPPSPVRTLGHQIGVHVRWRSALNDLLKLSDLAARSLNPFTIYGSAFELLENGFRRFIESTYFESADLTELESHLPLPLDMKTYFVAAS